MPNAKIVSGRGARSRLRAVVCTGLFVLLCSGLSRSPAKAEIRQASNTGNPQVGEPSQRETTAEPAKGKTDQFRLNKESYEKAVAYSKAWYRLYFVSVGWGIAVLWLLLRLGVVGRLRDLAEQRTGSLVLQTLILLRRCAVALPSELLARGWTPVLVGPDKIRWRRPSE